MTQKWSPLPGRSSAIPGMTSSRDTSDAQERPAPRRTGLLSLLRGPTPPLMWVLVFAALLVVAETLVLYPLNHLAAVRTLGVVYLIGVLVVAVVWGFWLAAATAVASVLAFDYFHVPPIYSITPTQAGDWVAVTTYLIAALLASTLAGVARSRGLAEAYQGRKELERLFNLSAEMLGIGRSAYLTRVNPAWERTLGYSRRELLSRPFIDMVHPADHDLVLKVLEELFHRGGPVHFENREVCKDGSVVWLEGNAVADQGGLYGAAGDVTERRREQDELRVLAEQQAALRRVATLVARGAPSSEVFSAVVMELAGCLGVYHAVLFRYESDDVAIPVAARDDDPGMKNVPIGERFSLEGESVVAAVLRTGRPARMDDYENASGSVGARFRELGLRTAVGAPIVVGRLWGAAIVGSSRPEPPPPDNEARGAD